MKKPGFVCLTAAIASVWRAGSCAAVTVAFLDNMNRSSFNASQNGWIVQSYAKGKGSFGLIPTAVNNNNQFQYSVDINGSGVASESNTVTSTAFALPTAGQYLELSANLNLDSVSASTPGLVFAVSAYGQDASDNQWATNYEFVTKQLNVGNQLAANDRLLLTSYNDYSATNPNGEWSSYVESGVDATSGFNTYTMRIFTNQVQYLVDNTVIATTTTDVPTGHSLSFELNCFAPDSSWGSAEAALPNNSSFYMDADWAKVSYGTVGTPAWVGTMSSDPLVLKESANWTNGFPGNGNEAVIDDSATVPATLYFGNTNSGSVGITQTLGALTINSSTLTAINANAGSTPSTSNTYAVSFAGNTGNTVPLISLGANVTQAVSISDSTNALLNLQIGINGGSINVTNAAASLTINSAITNASGVTAAFSKVGAGSLILNNALNSFGGTGQTITISGGILSINANGELGDPSNTITLDGGTFQANPSTGLTLARSILADSNGGTINLPSAAVTFSSPLSGSGTIIKTGTGELEFNSAAGTFNGTITVDAGNLRFINPGSIASGTLVQLVGTPTGNTTLNLRADSNLAYPINVQAITNPVQIFVAPQDAGNSGKTLSVGTINLGATSLSIGGNTSYSLQSGAITLSGNGTILTTTAPFAVASIAETAGSHSLTKSGALRLTLNGAGTYSSSTNVSAGTFEIAAGGSLASTPITVSAGATLAVDSGATLAGGSNLTDNGAVTLGANPTTGILSTTLRTLAFGYNGSVAGSLALATASAHANRTVLTISGDGTTSGLTFAGSNNAWHGQLDLGGNDMIVKNGNLANITNQLKSGFTSGNYWDGPSGIVSTAAASDTNYLTTLGVLQNTNGSVSNPLPLYGTNGVFANSFDGQTPTTSDVLVKYTYYGDADLNGTVNGADYQQIDDGFGNHLTGWSNGDFNYDGVIDGSDYSLIDNTFNELTATGAMPLGIVAATSSSAVPEPTAVMLLGLTAVAGLMRRRR